MSYLGIMLVCRLLSCIDGNLPKLQTLQTPSSKHHIYMHFVYKDQKENECIINQAFQSQIIKFISHNNKETTNCKFRVHGFGSACLKTNLIINLKTVYIPSNLL